MADDTKGWTLVQEAAPVAVLARPDSSTGMMAAAAPVVLPAAARLAMETATNPAVPRIGSTVGQIAGGIEGLMKGGPLAAAGGAWVGGKAGWFTGKLAQKIAAPIAGMAEAAAPYVNAVAPITNAAGVGALAQMAEPNRKDIGFLGMSNAGGPIDAAHVPAANEAIAKIAERMGRPDIAAQWRGQISKGR